MPSVVNLDARSTCVEVLDMSIYPLFGYDPAIVPMIILTKCATLVGAGWVYLQRGETVLAEDGPPSLARL